MQAIVTKLLPATRTRPARVKATCLGWSFTVNASGSEIPHALACFGLARKRALPGVWVGGSISDESIAWVYCSAARIDSTDLPGPFVRVFEKGPGYYRSGRGSMLVGLYT